MIPSVLAGLTHLFSLFCIQSFVTLCHRLLEFLASSFVEQLFQSALKVFCRKWLRQEPYFALAEACDLSDQRGKSRLRRFPVVVFEVSCLTYTLRTWRANGGASERGYKDPQIGLLACYSSGKYMKASVLCFPVAPLPCQHSNANTVLLIYRTCFDVTNIIFSYRISVRT